MKKEITATRIKNLPPYIFDALDQKRKAILKQGKDLIDLSVGDPDIMPNRPLIQLLKSALDKPAVHRYPPYKGTEEMLQTIADCIKEISAGQSG